MLEIVRGEGRGRGRGDSTKEYVGWHEVVRGMRLGIWEFGSHKE